MMLSLTCSGRLKQSRTWSPIRPRRHEAGPCSACRAAPIQAAGAEVDLQSPARTLIQEDSEQLMMLKSGDETTHYGTL